LKKGKTKKHKWS